MPFSDKDPAQVQLNILTATYKPLSDQVCEEFREIIEECFQLDPNMRPTA